MNIANPAEVRLMPNKLNPHRILVHNVVSVVQLSSSLPTHSCGYQAVVPFIVLSGIRSRKICAKPSPDPENNVKDSKVNVKDSRNPTVTPIAIPITFNAARSPVDEKKRAITIILMVT